MYSDGSSTESVERPSGRRKWHRAWWGRLLLLVFVIFIILLIAYGIYFLRILYLVRTGQLDADQFFGLASNTLNQVADEFYATTDDPSFGPEDAAVVIVEFSDFQCPACAQAHTVVNQIKAAYGQQVRFVYRDFPVVDVHPQSVLAALAANCAFDQGRFWEMHDKIFAAQDAISEASLKTYAVQLGLNGVEFGSCLEQQKYLAEIEEDLREGITAGVGATPTFFINGAKIRGAAPFAVFESAILAALNR